MKDWNEDEIIPISTISHHLYCERQNALIHTEGVFMENELTVSGDIGHQFVDEEQSYEDHGIHKETSFRVYSDVYGMTGIADIIEFPDDAPPFPIDYKNGKVASWENQEAQVCAIAICLEEMLDTEVPKGAIYHIQSKKRHEFFITKELKNVTLKVVEEVRYNLMNKIVPIKQYSKLCDKCSLIEHCIPKLKRKNNVNIFKPVDFYGKY